MKNSSRGRTLCLASLAVVVILVVAVGLPVAMESGMDSCLACLQSSMLGSFGICLAVLAAAAPFFLARTRLVSVASATPWPAPRASSLFRPPRSA